MSIVLMKALESQPSRYDRGITLLTLGKINRLYERAIREIHEGDHVLDLGCGTGALALKAARKASKVKGIDINPEMLEILKQKANAMKLKDKIEIEEKGIAELDSEPAGSYDIITAGLLFSELSPNEASYCLQQCYRILKPSGKIVIIDEVIPRSFWRRIAVTTIRVPLVILSYLLTQTKTRMIPNLEETVSDHGFTVKNTERVLLDSLIFLVALKLE